VRTGADLVSLNHVARRTWAGEQDAIVLVARNDVVDDGVARAIEDEDAVEVGHGLEARRAEANRVALDAIAGGSGAGDVDAVGAVAGDDVAVAGQRSADQVPTAVPDDNAVEGVAQVLAAAEVGADLAPLNLVVIRTLTDLDAVGAVGGDGAEVDAV